MLTRVYSAAVVGIDGVEVEIEVNETRGNSGKVYMVGLPDVAVKESKDRVLPAVANSGYAKPRGTTTINLAPGDLRKEGPSFDLAIALGMVALEEKFDSQRLSDYCVVGELALTGALRPVRGVLPIALEARRRGKRALLVPEGNADEASVVEGIDVYGIGNLREAVDHLNFVGGQACPGNGVYPRVADLSVFEEQSTSGQDYAVDFAEVKGQAHVKRAIEVAIAGGHNLIMVGPPGTGKSMLAKRIPTIMPPMSLEEAIETTRIHSITGLLGERSEVGSEVGGEARSGVRGGVLATRPFRAPHHTISNAGLLGGTNQPRPGEVSLAHHGVLFLDELPEFHRSTLEVLRQPLEDRRATISRAAGTMTFPADFVLVCAMNPCPCGYMGDPKRECRCGPGQVQKYRQRVSGPLLDRIDLHVEVPLVEYRELAGDGEGESSAAIRKRVMAAREAQAERYDGDIRDIGARKRRRRGTNSVMTPGQVKGHCGLDAESAGFLEHAMNELNFSARAHDRILKVSRTLADMEGRERIAAAHVMEAIQYRSLDRNLWR